MHALNRVLAKFGKRRWLAVPAGLAVALMSASALFTLFVLKDFSSHVRDAYEAPPGPSQYVVFVVVCAALLSLMVCGLWFAALGIRKPRGN